MSTYLTPPVSKRGLLVVALLCAVIALLAFWIEEDPRIVADKKGTFLPIWSLRDLGRAMHDYHSQHGRLPPAAVYDKEGAPLLSWRVLLLPYLENDELFRQFKLDEPWNSPHNLQLLPKMPALFSPLDAGPPSVPVTTFFQVFVGKGTAFEGREGLRFKDIPRRSYTVLIVEAAKAVPWTKPEDLAFDENLPLPKLGAIFEGRFHVVMADGCALRFPQRVDEAKLRAAILRNGDGAWPWEE